MALTSFPEIFSAFHKQQKPRPESLQFWLFSLFCQWKMKNQQLKFYSNTKKSNNFRAMGCHFRRCAAKTKRQRLSYCLLTATAFESSNFWPLLLTKKPAQQCSVSGSVRFWPLGSGSVIICTDLTLSKQIKINNDFYRFVTSHWLDFWGLMLMYLQ